jgi:integrase
MANIERRRNTWYATLHVPKDVQHIIGKAKLFETLKTTDKRVAETRAAPLVAKWKARIAAARGESDPFVDKALMWRQEIETNEAAEVVRDLIEEEAKKFARAQGPDAGAAFYGVATGTHEPLLPHFDDWAAQLTLAPKTVDQMKKDVRLMIKHFGTVEAITGQGVREWVRALMRGTPASQGTAAKPGASESSIKRIISFSRNFWVYLQEIEKAPGEVQPFVVPSFTKKAATKATTGKGGWEPFLPHEVVSLLNAAVEKGDQELADLIRLGMYTGARIEELCALKVESCTKEVLSITDSKTDAGIRQVPVHSAVVEVVNRLMAASQDGYLLSGLTFNKYGDRSNAIGKRFGRLKASLGFSEKKVFHSIRKTVVTLLEDAGVSENLTADIVGHEKPRITYGLYSGGHSLAPMKEAIEKIFYPA